MLSCQQSSALNRKQALLLIGVGSADRAGPPLPWETPQKKLHPPSKFALSDRTPSSIPKPLAVAPQSLKVVHPLRGLLSRCCAARVAVAAACWGHTSGSHGEARLRSRPQGHSRVIWCYGNRRVGDKKEAKQALRPLGFRSLEWGGEPAVAKLFISAAQTRLKSCGRL